MHTFNRILVGLDNTAIDKDLIKAASELCELADTKEVFFINVIKDFDLPDSIKKEFPDLMDKAINERKTELQKSVSKYFTYEDAKIGVNVLVDQGSVTKTLLKISAKEKADLFILGRKNDKNPGVLIPRIARRAFCSLLILPKGRKLKLENLLVGTDFSNYSKEALERAVGLAIKSNCETKITVQHVFQVPNGYHYAGKSFKEFGQIMEENAKKNYQRFIGQFDLAGVDLSASFTLDKDDDIIQAIAKEAKKQHADLLVIGVKGRTSTAALFIGSKAERLVQLNEEIPMLVIRPKGKAAGLIDYLKDL